MRQLLKVLGLVFALLFLWGAYVQLNDPDAWVWVAIYVLAAVVSLLFVVDKLPLVLTWVLLLACLIGAFVFWPETFEGYTIGEGDIKNIEEARESSGLLIMGLILSMYAMTGKRK